MTLVLSFMHLEHIYALMVVAILKIMHLIQFIDMKNVKCLILANDFSASKKENLIMIMA